MSWRTPGVPTLAVAPETVMHFSLYGSGSTLIHIRGGIPLAWPRGGRNWVTRRRTRGGAPGHAKTRVLLAGHDFSGSALFIFRFVSFQRGFRIVIFYFRSIFVEFLLEGKLLFVVESMTMAFIFHEL